jgi:hypothetical protein
MPPFGGCPARLLVTNLSWRWVFYVNVPIRAAAIVFGAIFLRQRAQTQPGYFGLAGFLLSGIGLGLLMYGVSKGRDLGWGSVEVLAAIAAGALLLVAMAAVELRTAEPIVALRLLGNRLFRSSTGVHTCCPPRSPADGFGAAGARRRLQPPQRPRADPARGRRLQGERAVIEALLDGGADPTAGIPSAVETARGFGLDDLVALFEGR